MYLRARVDAVSSVASSRFLSILIADDDRDTVNTLEAILVDEGHTVHKVYSGEEVLGAVKRYRPDVCILDIEMPGPSGYAAAQQVLTAMGLDRPVLIAISGRWTKKSEQLLARSVGFDRFFIKPADPEELLRFVDVIAGSWGPTA